MCAHIGLIRMMLRSTQHCRHRRTSLLESQRGLCVLDTSYEIIKQISRAQKAHEHKLLDKHSMIQAIWGSKFASLPRCAEVLVHGVLRGHTCDV
eukprot:384191-Amphidinium_carterae.1